MSLGPQRTHASARLRPWYDTCSGCGQHSKASDPCAFDCHYSKRRCVQVDSSDLDVVGAHLLSGGIQPMFSGQDHDDPELLGVDLAHQLTEAVLEDVDFEELEVI